VDSANQQASAAVAAATTAADQQAGFDIRMAKAEHDAGGMKASYTVALESSHFSQSSVPDSHNFVFALPANSYYQDAFDKLTVDSANQQASAAVAAATAADQQAGFDIRMAKAEHDAGGMKASFTALLRKILGP